MILSACDFMGPLAVLKSHNMAMASSKPSHSSSFQTSKHGPTHTSPSTPLTRATCTICKDVPRNTTRSRCIISPKPIQLHKTIPTDIPSDHPTTAPKTCCVNTTRQATACRRFWRPNPTISLIPKTKPKVWPKTILSHTLFHAFIPPNA